MKIVFALGVLLALGACSASNRDAGMTNGDRAAPGGADPALVGNATACGSLPPSGYCIVPEAGR